jgi:ABC-type lipoprotein export system ATPase subunit
LQTINIVKKSKISNSVRVQQLGAIFDMPLEEEVRESWRGEIDIDSRDWNVGLIVGPSGSGKSTIAGDLFDISGEYAWNAESVIDDFSKDFSLEEIASICQSVGFNTIPSWIKPYRVLSTGEKFRVSLARSLLETKGICCVDEFTSVVDRQVAQIGSHAVQKYIRKHNRKFVAVACHHDIIDWLQPDWVFEPATMRMTWRLLRRRPKITGEICRVSPSHWKEFSRYHYMSASLVKQAACFVIAIDDSPAAFAGVIHRPHAKTKNIKGITRLVTLPDWQGLGLAFILLEHLGAAYKALGYYLHMYPAHPSLIRSFYKNKDWNLRSKSGFSTPTSKSSTLSGRMGGRPCAVFRYCGKAMNYDKANDLVYN